MYVGRPGEKRCTIAISVRSSGAPNEARYAGYLQILFHAYILLATCMKRRPTIKSLAQGLVYGI